MITAKVILSTLTVMATVIFTFPTKTKEQRDKVSFVLRAGAAIIAFCIILTVWTI